MNNINGNKKELPAKEPEELLRSLKARFEKNMNRHKGLQWDRIQAKLKVNAEKLWSINEMEETGSEPDVVGYNKKTDEYIFYDCTAEALKDAERLVTTMKGRQWRKSEGRIREVTLLIWQLPWALSF